jgi:pyruvate dehydrogenase E2 component (dihydrolipoamide acetyltransferase)
MAINVKMPRLSDTMEVGTVVKWNVKEGQSVKSGDEIADIETDKATMPLQAFDDGTVALLSVPEGESVRVGTTILVLAEAGETVAAAKGAGGAKAVADGAAASGQTTAARGAQGSGATVEQARAASGAGNGAVAAPAGSERVFASPLARKIAEEKGINLAGVEGTGPSGRVTRRDVEAAVGGGAAPTAPARRGDDAGAPPAALHRSAPMPASLPALGAALKGQTVTLSNMRRTIAKRLVESKATIPHYQVTVAARMDALLVLRQQLNEQLAAQGVKLSVNDFLVRACALAMHEHPFINSRWIERATEVAVEVLPAVNIGVAIALPMERGGGLVVATLRNADQMGLRQISAQTKALAEKARSKGLTIEEMADSTFTISNLGMLGVDHFTAIINPPNTAILAVGAAIEKPVVETDPKSGEKRLAIGHEMSMTMSSDHRVIDGAMAAQYLATVKGLLERPATLLV